ncbi:MULTISPECIES: molybdate ABC transporter substrate-binding protein [unclassified Rathayibacter]|uniref:molybdate ABC transporter substrate-binding protein n=1 Tax=unclassified Rathayibacter TaxID=2609250 RepID=UPI00188C37B6|nr:MULTISPECIES: molybdate ABC transporter substrate-binding protein [unclassified Rathayibacter]MBF4461967.1 molybdate ABC transporter substrate-binding protein [Rathayibacter sp. VKM Ac-2879]MBF4503990.1 molybdate ABC transporter substrate-binding protein [Rathayibacter sp. VKM Ac-2878]
MNVSRAFASVAATGALLTVLAGCSAGTSTAEGSASASASATPTSSLSGSITVFAAASLKGTFTELASAFEEENPGTTVELNFAGSSDLVTQITNGAPADVFASADEKNMVKLIDAALIEGAPVDFATNTLEIAVPPTNPAGITGFADLAKEGVKTVICAAQVPCGAATVTVEGATGVDIQPVSEESSVTDVLGKVTSGEADAGLVYVTDVTAAGDAVKGITFAESSEAVNTYPIAPVKAAANPEVAAAFAEYVTSDAGLKVLAAAGFGAP